MANEPMITVIGNATEDAQLRFTPNGVGVASWTVAVTPRTKQGDTWSDGESTFYRCSAWRQLAEPCAETIKRGMRLIVHGRLTTRSYDKDGQTRISIELDVEGVGPDLRFATAAVTKSSGNGGSQPSRSKRAGGEVDWAGASPAGSDSPPF